MPVTQKTIQISLPDGSQKTFNEPITVAEIASSIGAGLAKATLAGKVNGQLVDTSYRVNEDAEVKMITAKDKEGLEILRHSTAHLLAHAVKQLFPTAQVTIGPVIEDGFYYDFSYPPGFHPDDLPRLEAQMQALIEADLPVKRSTMVREEAVRFFQDLGETYKAEIISEIPAGETLSVYEQGDFVDLCRGPHVPSTGYLNVFKLMKIAGAYWRGNPNNEMLQRIYGTAWPDKKSLDAYLHRLAEAEKRDHRKLAQKMDLFHFQEEAPGMVFWHDKGWTLYQLVQHYIRGLLKAYNYQEIRTPQIVDKQLWERSGHWSKFGNEMFSVEADNRTYAIKPMSCPCHVQVFNASLKSYRDLPLRYAEFGVCHRDEASGALHGLMRLRQFTQDDAHVFCTPDQIQTEISRLITLFIKVYRDFGFEDLAIKLSTRPEKRVGDDKIWDQAESALQKALEESKLDWELQPGDGAFYGPKIDMDLRDSIGRLWQCGTIQLDFSMPERLGAHYINEHGEKQTPVMIHRAILGSLERFIGVLIEHYAGNLPLWLAPVQVVIMNITENQVDYATKIAEECEKNGLRVNLDLRNEQISYKIREHTIQHVPYLLIIGDREKAAGTVAVRKQTGERLGSLTFDALLTQIKKDTLVNFDNKT